MKKDKTEERAERFEDDGRKKKNWLGVLLIVLEVIVIIVLAYILIKQKNKNDESEIEKKQEAENKYHEIEENKTQILLYNYLIINEVDKSGNVEILNTSAYDASLTEECALYVNGEKLIVYTGTMAKSGGVLSASCGRELKKGDYLVLYYGNEICDSLFLPFLPNMEYGASYGRNADDYHIYAYFDQSIGESNKDKAIKLLDDPYFSAPSGFYDDAFELYIFKDENQKVYYTLDGTEPTLESKVYESPIRITNVSGLDNVYSAIGDVSIRNGTPSSDVDKCVVLRAVAIDDNGNKGKESTANYFVGYSTKSAFKGIPTLTIVTEPDSMFDYFNGGYVLGRAYEDALARGASSADYSDADYYFGWESKGRLEYYEANKTLSAQSDVTLSVKIDNAVDYSQKSLKIVIGDGDGLEICGMGRYLHGDSNTFLLDASGSDNTFKLRDLLVNDMLKGSQVLTRDITPVSVFIDGEYWGIYCMEDYYDKAYLSEKLGIDANNLQIADTDTQNDDYEQDLADFYELYNFVVENDLTDSSIYKKVTDMMDIQSYLDCYCSHIYVGDSEYPADDDYVFRVKKAGAGQYEDGKWRWAFGNADNSMCIAKVNNFSVDTYLRPQISGDAFMASLMRNKEFNAQFVETMNSMATVWFNPERIEPWLAEATTEISKAVIRSALRFGITITDTSFSAAATIIQKFFDERAYYIGIYTQEFSQQGLERPYIPPVSEEDMGGAGGAGIQVLPVDPEDPNYVPPVDPEDPNYVPPVDPQDPNYVPTVDPQDPNYVPPVDPQDPNYVPPVDPQEPTK